MSNIENNSKTRQKKIIFILDIVVILLLSYFMCVYKIGDNSYPPGDSTRHSIVVQTMNKTGDYLHPKMITEPYYNKPPFKMWITAFAVSLLGESNFSYRVVDGLTGVALGLTVFYFSLQIFSSWTIAYLSLLSLLGVHILFYGHGIRDSSQDPMMILLMTWGIIAGWNLIQLLNSTNKFTAEESKLAWKSAIIGGVCVGLSTLTKNIVGFYAFAIIGIYLVVSKQLVPTLSRGKSIILSVVLVSVSFLPAYLLAQGPLMNLAFREMFFTEIYYRVTEGFHNIDHDWFYWNLFFRHRQVVPPEIFLLGIIFSLYFYYKKKDNKYLFLLSWAILPLIVQNLIKSKLRWYILPAVPAMAILCGLALGVIYKKLIKLIKTVILQEGVIQGKIKIQILSFSILVFGGTYSLGHNVYKVIDDFYYPKEHHAVDKITEAIKEYGFKNNKEVNFLYYEEPSLISYEHFYFGMKPIVSKRVKSLEQVKEEVESKKVDFVITNADDFEKIIHFGKPASYFFLPKENLRERTLMFLNYNPDINIYRAQNMEKIFPALELKENVIFGLKSPTPFKNSFVLANKSDEFALLLDSDRVLAQFDTELVLELASTYPEDKGKINLEIFLNNEKLSSITGLTNDFNNYRFKILAGKFSDYKNYLGFKCTVQNNTEGTLPEKSILLRSLQLVSLP